MLAWMLYATLASILIGGAALAIERVLHSLGRPTRFAWVGAAILSCVWPVGMWFSAPPAVSAPSTGTVRSTLAEGVQVASTSVAVASREALNVSVESIVLAAWTGLTVLLTLRVIYAVHSTQRRARFWQAAKVEGVHVRMSRDTGPAVIGIAEMQVVLPEWVLTLDSALLDLVLAHEEEHRRARDPLLIFGAAAVVCLMPWNVGLIWQARRLRLALEIDCDTRVLDTYPDSERYGRLLLAMAQRRSNGHMLLGATMSEPATNLARRLTAMQRSPVSRVRLAAFASVGTAAIVAACAMESPTAARESTTETQPTDDVEVITEKRTTADTNEMMRVILDGIPKIGDLQLVFRKVAYDERRMVELMESVAVEYERTLQRTGSADASVNTVLEDIAKLENLVGGPVEVWIGESRLQLPEREIQLPTQRKQPEMTALFETDSLGKSTLLDFRLQSNGRKRPATSRSEQSTAQLTGGTMNPVYPELRKQSGVEGTVDASFVVREDGTADVGTFTVHSSSDVLFTESVRSALETARFRPARVNGVVVKQRLRLPFTFSIK